MKMDLAENLVPLSPAVQDTLAALRHRIRAYVWAEGLAAGAAWVGLAFWLSLAIDWLCEPSAPVRVIMLIAAAVGLVIVLALYIGRRAFVPLSDSNMATLLERRFFHFQDSLLTAVLLHDRRPENAGFNHDMLARACGDASRRVQGVRIGEVFNWRPLRLTAGAAVLLLLATALFALAAPAKMGIWARRTLALSPERWPRTTRLSVVDFENGRVKIAAGEDFEVIVRADRKKPLAPDRVDIRYHIGDSTSGSAAMKLLSAASQEAEQQDAASPPEGSRPPEPDQYKYVFEYSHTFHSLLAPTRFDVFGGGDSLRDLEIEVVEPPLLVQEKTRLACHYPDYMEHPDDAIPMMAVAEVFMGTRITLQAVANKELVRVEVEVLSDQKPAAPSRIIKRGELTDGGRGFSYALEPLMQDATLLVTLFDVDGIKSRKPVQLALVAKPDMPPQLAVRLAGIGSAVTPQARLPVAGRITDDWGIGRVWFEYAVDQRDPATVALLAPPKHPTELPLADAALELPELKLKPGQKLLVCLKAADLYRLTLADKKTVGPNVGTSERWLLDVVSPEQLRAMLEARELVLRQRFESIKQDVTDTRDALLKMRFGAEAAAAEAKPAAEEKKPPSVAAPGEELEAPVKLSPQQQLEALAMRVDRGLQNSRKSAQETLGVADGFDDIRQQLTNNRIDTEELKQRLGPGIADPLRHIAGQMFPDLDRRLEALEAVLADPARAPERRQAALAQADEIILAMHKVLDRMIQLEDYNELVQSLRAIIKEHQDVTDRTKQRHKQELRDQLEK